MDRELGETPWNGFQEQIQLTKTGKLWRFPVDNEYGTNLTEQNYRVLSFCHVPFFLQGLEDELDVPFTDHVFLEEHLSDFPQRPSVLHFMELVCVGLSQNRHMSVQEKLEHIHWYRDFFQQHDQHFADESNPDVTTVEGGGNLGKQAQHI